MHLFFRRYLRDIITALFLIVVGILLLINPVAFAMGLVKLAGVFLVVLGALRIVRYFRTDPETAARGQDFFIGLIAILGGLFCIFFTGWFLSAFTTLAVIYGLLQLLLGFSKVQRTVDFLRMELSLWYLPACSALIYLVFGFIIVLNPEMTLINVWVFTGVTMILEGIITAVCLFLLERERREAKMAKRKEKSSAKKSASAESGKEAPSTESGKEAASAETPKVTSSESPKPASPASPKSASPEPPKEKQTPPPSAE
jgi:uncharacterized membrane protein HdeD (DUF308 family)